MGNRQVLSDLFLDPVQIRSGILISAQSGDFDQNPWTSSGIPDFQKCSLANMGCALPQTPLELRDCVGGSGVYFGKNNYFNRHLGLQKINYPFREFSLENKTAQT